MQLKAVKLIGIALLKSNALDEGKKGQEENDSHANHPTANSQGVRCHAYRDFFGNLYCSHPA